MNRRQGERRSEPRDSAERRGAAVERSCIMCRNCRTFLKVVDCAKDRWENRYEDDRKLPFFQRVSRYLGRTRRSGSPLAQYVLMKAKDCPDYAD